MPEHGRFKPVQCDRKKEELIIVPRIRFEIDDQDDEFNLQAEKSIPYLQE